ncbi:zinc-binding dehydrogenase [Nocardia suismassiliense]|uniref:zinc-binding dehydrogenase n=1 Tax=Nocardia suismassiliense TaxID=2077092 RepID=UPI000D1EEA46|nr:zinc-binding dehydrogenase [Nocardia suismassiliense]
MNTAISTSVRVGSRLWTDGGINNLRLIDCDRLDPGAREIEIAVSHAGINFRDLLVAVDGPDGAYFGAECAGVVTRIGGQVSGVAVGDAVLAYAPGGLQSHVVVPAEVVVARPDSIPAAMAAAVPIVYGTAYHALVERARVRSGERVLIQSATGGLGLVAVSVARRAGAIVYATAGNPARRELLRRLGVRHVADSRTLTYAETFRDPAGGGVDVVLSAHTGDSVEAALSLLNPFGRYVDVTMPDNSPLRIPVAALSHCRSYLQVELHDLFDYDRSRLRTILQKVVTMVEQGELPEPLIRVFPVEQAADAFGQMLRSEHLGKFVLAFPSPRTEP